MRIYSLPLLFCASTAVAQVTTFVPISNTNQPVYGEASIPGGESLAVSFTTGNTAVYLYTVSIVAAGGIQNSGLPDFQLSIFNSTNGAPGHSLAALAGSSFPYTSENSAVFTYTNVNAEPLVLSSNTQYWVVAATTGLDNENYLSITTSTNVDPGSVWQLGPMEINYASGWSVYPSTVFQFSLTVTNPIAPAISISQPVVLIYPTPGFNFVLQQNSDLNSPNWVTASNAILSGVISNQSVFIISPTAPHLFYRLTLE